MNRTFAIRLPRGIIATLTITGTQGQLKWLDQMAAALRWMATPVLWIAAALVLLSRDPFRLLDAQLWAEDGPLWVYDAYTTGLGSLLVAHTGYLQTFPRLVGFSTDVAPLEWVPTIFALAGFVVQLAPAWMVLSVRGRRLIPNRWARLALVGFYVGVPNSFETFVNITNAQWHLAIILLLVMVMRPPRALVWRLVEYAAIVIGGLSGPFSFLLTPLAWWQGWREGALRGVRGVQAGLFTVTAAIQAWVVVVSAGSQRHLEPLGASVGGFARIVVGQIYLAAVIGSGEVSRLEQGGLWRLWWFPVLLLVGFGAISILAFLRGSVHYRLLTIFAALVLASALWSPVISTTQPQWDALELPGAGSRYYLLPILAWFCGLLVLGGDEVKWVRWGARVAVVLSVMGMRNDWHYGREPETGFVAAARVFEAAPVGANVIFREAPNPAVWLFSLTKK